VRPAIGRRCVVNWTSSGERPRHEDVRLAEKNVFDVPAVAGMEGGFATVETRSWAKGEIDRASCMGAHQVSLGQRRSGNLGKKPRLWGYTRLLEVEAT